MYEDMYEMKQHFDMSEYSAGILGVWAQLLGRPEGTAGKLKDKTGEKVIKTCVGVCSKVSTENKISKKLN